MKKRYYVFSAIVVSAVVLAGTLWWLTVKVLPNLGIVHLVPLEEKGRQLPQNGDAITVFKNSKFEGYRGIESIETDWSGVAAVWPHILVGMILGAVAGYFLGYFMGFPERHLIEFAEKSVDHANETLWRAEILKSDAARMISIAKAMKSKNSQRRAELDQREKELQRKSDEAERLLAYAHGLIREMDEKGIELTKAQAIIKRLKKRNAPQKEETIDEVDKPV